MRPLRVLGIVIAMTLMTMAAARAARADYPQYLVLPPSHGLGYATPSAAPRYAYGWFGMAPRHHASRHFGYYRDFTQWTRK